MSQFKMSFTKTLLLDIRVSWSWNGRETWEHAVNLLDRNAFDLDPMIINHYDLKGWETAFANLRAKQDDERFKRDSHHI